MKDATTIERILPAWFGNTVEKLVRAPVPRHANRA